MTRLAVERMRRQGLDPRPVLRGAGLTLDEVESAGSRFDVGGQVALLGLAAQKLDDPLLGFHLAETAELRHLGLLYFVFASSSTLQEGLAAAQRYSSVVNEGIAVRPLSPNQIGAAFACIGVPRHTDRHQIEICATVLVRVARDTTGTSLRPTEVTFVHPAVAESRQLDAFFGCPVRFGAERDTIVFKPETGELPLVKADPYLRDLLTEYCEEALSHRTRPVDTLRTRIENIATPLLPHGKARAGEVARQLGMSQRTLARRLAVEGLAFAKIVDELRADLARHYLRDSGLSVSEIAWLLGFQEVSSFTNAFKRWTGIPPSQARSPALTGALVRG
jgi:AraC-like DNA-binding protein